MFIRIALLASLAVTMSCEKQRRTIVTGFKKETLEKSAKAQNATETTTTTDTSGSEPETREKVEKVSTLEPAGIVIPEIKPEAPLFEDKKREKVEKVSVIKPAGIVTVDSMPSAELPEDIDIPHPAVPLRESEEFTTMLQNLFDSESTKIIRAEASKLVIAEAIQAVNEIRIETNEGVITDLLEVDGDPQYNDIIDSLPRLISSAAGNLLKVKMIEAELTMNCGDCLVNFESLEISIDKDNQVIISSLKLNEEYQNEEKYYQDGALPELNGSEKNSDQKALLLSQIHYNEIAFAEVDEDQEIVPAIEPSFQAAN